MRLLLLLFTSLAVAQEVGDTGFRRHALPNGGEFYVAVAKNARAALPLVVWAQGTGCESHFYREGERVGARTVALVREAAAGRAVVLAAEKPGVRYLDDPAQPGNARTCRPEFRERFTLDGWANTLAAAIAAVRRMPGVDGKRVLVLGHSEGGLVAIRVSNLATGVTHAASLAGGGPVFLFHIVEYLRRRGDDVEGDGYRCQERVLASPHATDRFCWGGTHRQWSSFMKTSIIEEALRSPSKLYFIHGSEDEQNTVAGFDVLRATLVARGRPAVWERIEGADHAFSTGAQPLPEGLSAVFQRVLAWFLSPKS